MRRKNSGWLPILPWRSYTKAGLRLAAMTVEVATAIDVAPLLSPSQTN